MQKFDLLIVGGGMVGLTLALAIRKQSQLTVAIVDASPLKETTDEPELRVSAINIASHNIFTNLDVWPLIESQRLQPYQHMSVWDKNSIGKISFELSDVNTERPVEQLGWIIENNVIRTALWNKAKQDAGITFFTDEPLSNIGMGDSEVFASFTQQMPISAKLVVGADGANSWVRKQMDMSLTFRDYDHHAIVATVKVKPQHHNTAWQVFLPTGPLALLPLFEDELCSIVWSTSPEESQRLLSLSKEEFSKELTAAADGKLGNIELVSERYAHPLTMRFSQEFFKGKAVLVGDAAHTIHPLAGQGVNLGLLDAASLAQIITTSPDSEKSTKEWASSIKLNEYARWRKAEAAEMIAAMESIKQIFAVEQKAPAFLRGVGMAVLDNIKPVKSMMIKQALGLKENLPNLAK